MGITVNVETCLYIRLDQPVSELFIPPHRYTFVYFLYQGATILHRETRLSPFPNRSDYHV
jgi:hypothetical protein